MYKTLDEALKLGYRLIDTAGVYKNEEDIGSALKELCPKYGLTRSDLFITSKLGPACQGTQAAYDACVQSLQHLQMDYVDLYLIHWPGISKLKPHEEGHAEARRQSWMTLERLQKEGKARNIGVSNYTVQHLDQLLTHATICPAVLQVEYHPYLVQTDLLEWCHTHNTHLQAYSSLGRGQMFDDTQVKEIATRLHRKPSQVLLKWALQQNIGVIPKTSNPERLAENAALWDLELTTEDMDTLKKLNKNQHICWDPTQIV